MRNEKNATPQDAAGKKKKTNNNRKGVIFGEEQTSSNQLKKKKSHQKGPKHQNNPRGEGCASRKEERNENEQKRN